MSTSDRLRAAVLAVAACWPVVAVAQGVPRYGGLEPDAFLKRWSTLGPVPVADGGAAAPDEATQRKAFDADLLAACGGEARLGAKGGGACLVGTTRLRLAPVETEGDVLDLAAKLGRKDFVVAYAVAEVEATAASRVLLGLGSDDGVKVWLNGRLVHQTWAQRGVVRDQDILRLDLPAGRNRLVLKVQNGSGAWGFCVRALSPQTVEQRLWQAARAGELAQLERLLDAAPPSALAARPKLGLTAWQIARIAGRADEAALLAARGADAGLPLPSPEAIVEAMFLELTAGRTAGAAVLVSRDGKVVFERGFGYASLEHGVRITPATKFRIGSITKQFTAAAILRLQEQGKLSVGDRLSRFLPDFPRAEEVTLHHLLTHTSGLHSYTNKPDFLRTVTVPTTSEELIASFKNDPFDFAPGTKWDYCNSGYLLLGHLVEKVSGQPYGDFLRAQFFEPLGMKDTGVHRNDAILEDEATGYFQEGDVLRKALNWDMSRAGGAGALYSTVGDLARWNEAVFGGRVLGPDSLKAALTPVAVAGAERLPDEGYGYGWFVGKLRGLEEVQHGGGLQGFISQLSRYPGERLTVVVLANAAPPVPGLLPGTLARDIAQVYLGHRMADRPSAKALMLPPAALDSFVGRYDYGGPVLTVTREGSQLYAQLTGQPRFEIFARGEAEFFWKVVEAKITFVKDANGRVTKGVHVQGGQTLEAPKLE